MRIDKPTPNGGDYSEMFYLDNNGNIVSSPDVAAEGVIRECLKDGTIIFVTHFAIDRGDRRG